jgi:hypothetical protein
VAKKEKAAAPKADAEGQGRVRLAEHPRAQRQIALAKGWGGLLGFGLVLWFSLDAGVAPPNAMARALACGIALYVLAWAVSVTIWGQLAVGEVHAQRRRMLAERERRRAEAAGAAAPDQRAAA